jgi:hypothetical protein
VEFGVYLEAAAPFGVIVGKRLDSDPFVAYALQFGESGRRVEFAQSTGEPGSYRSVASSSDVPFQTWTHVAATLDESVMRLLVNGTEVAIQKSPGLPPSASTVSLSNGAAAPSGSASSTFVSLGSLAVLREVRVWSRALTSPELLANMRPLTGNESGLLANWPLDEGGGQLPVRPRRTLVIASTLEELKNQK